MAKGYKHKQEGKIWYVYEMHEVLSPTGKPYIGVSADLKTRKYGHRKVYKLDHTPELIAIDGPYYTSKEARAVEQHYRLANGWLIEGYIQGKIATENGQIQALAKKNIENGLHYIASVNGGKITGKMLWVNKDGKNKRVKPSLLKDYLDRGFKRGQIKNKK